MRHFDTPPVARKDDAPADDNALMLRLGQGDARALSCLMDRHLLRTVRLAARLLGSDALADDVAQEVFLRVWRHAGHWQDAEARGARFTTWLYRITLNIVIDEKRKRTALPLDAVPEQVDGAPGPERRLVEKQHHAAVREALARLPDRQREAFVLCFYEELSNREAAQVLDISVKALESLLVRARRALRADLDAVQHWQEQGGGK